MEFHNSAIAPKGVIYVRDKLLAPHNVMRAMVVTFADPM